MKKIFLFKALILSLLLFSSCDKDDNVDIAMQNALYELYPNAIDVDWDYKHKDFIVADFTDASKEISAWFKGTDWNHSRIEMGTTGG